MACFPLTLIVGGQVVHEGLFPRRVLHGDHRSIGVGQGFQQIFEVVHGNVSTVLEIIIVQQGLSSVESDVFTRVLAGLKVLQLSANAIKVIFGFGLEKGAQFNVEDSKGGIFTAFQLIPEGSVHAVLQ